MPSVVDTSVKFFKSTMAGAPVLTGTAGSLLALLDAVLVDGFDLKTATSLAVNNGVATLTFTGTHSAEVDAVIEVAGSSIAALNGQQKVTGKTATTVTFATNASNGTASGTITFRMAPLGWGKAFSGANKAAYRSSDVTGSRFYLRLDDTDAQIGRVRGFETMSDVDTGTGGFPLAAQIPNGNPNLVWGKSWSAGSTPVPWTVIGDSKMFFICSAAYASNGGPRYVSGMLHGFGDMIPYRPSGDVWACALAASDQGTSWQSYPQYGVFDRADNAIWTPRNFTGIGSSYAMQSFPYTGGPNTQSGQDTSLGYFPSPVDGSLRLSKHFLRQFNAAAAPRCEVPGMLRIAQASVYGQINHHDVAAGANELAGRKLLGVSASSMTNDSIGSPGSTPLVMFDITGPWR